MFQNKTTLLVVLLFGYSSWFGSRDIIQGVSSRLISLNLFSPQSYRQMVVAATVAQAVFKIVAGMIVDASEYPEITFVVAGVLCGVAVALPTTFSAGNFSVATTNGLWILLYISVKSICCFARVSVLKVLLKYFPKRAFGKISLAMQLVAAAADSISHLVTAQLMIYNWHYMFYVQSAITVFGNLVVGAFLLYISIFALRIREWNQDTELKDIQIIGSQNITKLEPDSKNVKTSKTSISSSSTVSSNSYKSANNNTPNYSHVVWSPKSNAIFYELDSLGILRVRNENEKLGVNNNKKVEVYNDTDINLEKLFEDVDLAEDKANQREKYKKGHKMENYEMENNEDIEAIGMREAYTMLAKNKSFYVLMALTCISALIRSHVYYQVIFFSFILKLGDQNASTINALSPASICLGVILMSLVAERQSVKSKSAYYSQLYFTVVGTLFSAAILICMLATDFANNGLIKIVIITLMNLLQIAFTGVFVSLDGEFAIRMAPSEAIGVACNTISAAGYLGAVLVQYVLGRLAFSENGWIYISVINTVGCALFTGLLAYYYKINPHYQYVQNFR